MTALMPMQIREAQQSDKAFILATWKRSYQDSPVMRWTQETEAGRSAYFAHMNRTCATLLDRSKALVAANPVDSEHCFGWIVWQPDALHYCYVKRNYRRHHIAKRLLEAAGFGIDGPIVRPIVATHYTEAVRDCGHRHFLIDFNPALGEA